MSPRGIPAKKKKVKKKKVKEVKKDDINIGPEVQGEEQEKKIYEIVKDIKGENKDDIIENKSLLPSLAYNWRECNIYLSIATATNYKLSTRLININTIKYIKVEKTPHNLRYYEVYFVDDTQLSVDEASYYNIIMEK